MIILYFNDIPSIFHEKTHNQVFFIYQSEFENESSTYTRIATKLQGGGD